MRRIDTDRIDSSVPAGTRSTRLSRTLGSMDCTVTVVADDVVDLVHSAGGWIVDRIRAGWRVSVWLTSPRDVTPLVILGIRPEHIQNSIPLELPGTQGASLAIRCGLLAQSGPLSRQICELLPSHTTEIAVWGDGYLESERNFHAVHHHLSSAAQGFKKYALSGGSPSPTAGATEYFRCHAPWYPLDGGADLQRTNAG